MCGFIEHSGEPVRDVPTDGHIFRLAWDSGRVTISGRRAGGQENGPCTGRPRANPSAGPGAGGRRPGRVEDREGDVGFRVDVEKRGGRDVYTMRDVDKYGIARVIETERIALFCVSSSSGFAARGTSTSS